MAMGSFRGSAIALAALAAAAAVLAVVTTRLLVPWVLPVDESSPIEDAGGPPPEPTEAASDAGAAAVGPDGGGPGATDGGTVDAGDEGETDRRRSGRQRRRSAARDDRRERASPHIIERERIEHLAEHPEKLGGATARLHRTPGGHVGFVVRGIRPGTPLHGAGLRSGDILLSVNGVLLTSSDAALEAFTRFVDGSRVRVVLLRGGARRTLRFRIE